jgi:hypothetical protein
MTKKDKGDFEKFELSIDENIYVEGEKLYDAESVKELHKVDNNLYTAQVEDNTESYEVEIYKPASLQRKSSCDCEIYAKEKQCPHIVATLLSIRSRLSPIQAKKQVKRRPAKRKENKFTTKALSSLTSKEEMKSFIQEYARKDKRFDLFFKARFSKKMDMGENSLKYKSILDSLVPPAKKTDYKINTTSINLVIRFFEEFYTQMEDSMVLHQYTEAYDIFSPTFKKIAYVRHYARSEDEALSEVDIKFHKFFKTIITSQAAPELIDEIKKDTLALAAFSYYQVRDFQHNVLKILHDEDPLFDKNSIEIAQLHLDKNINEINLALFLYLKGADLESKNITKYYHNQQLLIKALKILLDHKGEEVVSSIIEITQQLGWRNSSLDELYLITLSFNKKYKAFIKFGMEKLKVTQQFYFYKLMDYHLPEAKKNLLVSAIEKHASDIHATCLCQIYNFNKNEERLMETISQMLDIEATMKYDAMLFETMPDRIASHYEKVVHSYLENHMGNEANSYVKKVLSHIRIRGGRKYAENIKKSIFEKFPQRKSFLTSYK